MALWVYIFIVENTPALSSLSVVYVLPFHCIHNVERHISSLCIRNHPICTITPFLTRSQNQGQATKNLTEEQKMQICNEVVHEHHTPTEVGKKWNVNPDTIRKWIRQKGLNLPKSYKKMSPG